MGRGEVWSVGICDCVTPSVSARVYVCVCVCECVRVCLEEEFVEAAPEYPFAEGFAFL